MKFVLALLFLAVYFCSASVIFHKTITDEYMGKGVNATVKLTVFNMGGESIYEVSVKDKWPAEYFEVIGDVETSFSSISSGESASHTYVIVPNFEGYYQADRAYLTYKNSEESTATLVGYSNPMFNATILPVSYYRKLTDSHSTTWFIYATGMFLTVGLPLLVWASQQCLYENGLPHGWAKKSL